MNIKGKIEQNLSYVLAGKAQLMISDGKAITANGEIGYRVLGAGHPVVMLRGLGRTIRHWAGFETEMAKHFQVIVLDLRGIGTNKIELKPWMTLFDMADDVISVLDHLGIDRATILGVSLGGMLTLACGIKYPQRCTSLVVINSSIAGQRAMRLSFNALFAITRAVWDKPRLQAGLVDALTGPEASLKRKKEIAELYEAIEREDGLAPKIVGAQLLAAARFLVAKDLKKINIPTLVMYGSHDRFVPNVHSKKIAALIPNANIVELAGAGHEAHLDKPDEFIAAVRKWVDGLTYTK